MIKYGLIVCLIASSSLFGMEVREDLKGLTYEQLKERERINKEADKAFKANYASDAWRFDDNIKKERDAIFEEQRALQTAILFGGHVSRESFKAHAITDSRRVEATATDVLPVANNTNTADQNKPKAQNFDEIFAAAIVKPAKRVKLIDQDPKRPQNRKALEEEIARLSARQDDLIEVCNSVMAAANANKAATADELDLIEDQLSELYKQRDLLLDNKK